VSFLFLVKASLMPATSKAATKRSSPNNVSKKSARPKDGIKIKYSDKSPGQPQLIPIFEEIKKMLAPYEKGTMKLFGGSDGKVVLVSKKPVEILGRKKDELWFASALVQKGYVGFYYMPVYGDPSIKKLIKPELLKCLKGKACFYIKKPDQEIFLQIKEALAIGYKEWHQRGWI
jgi:hypothetical protein